MQSYNQNKAENENQNFGPLRKTVWQFLEKLNTELACDPAILLLGVRPRQMKTHVHTKTCTWMFIAV